MTRSTKSQAKQQVEVYGDLLMDHAVISDVNTEEVRGQTRYSFWLWDKRYPYEVFCEGIQELALVLTAMWSSYALARKQLGELDEDTCDYGTYMVN